ncbi:AAA family ATPase [Sphingomonas sp. PB1R3]
MIEAVAKAHPDRPIVVGICGAQGSGKSTLAAALCARLDDTVTLSLDDLYRTRTEREQLARDVHPLLRTRGVPGTHDVALGLATLDGIAAGVATPLPRFSKAIDDRLPQSEWPVAPAGTQAVLIEGWCVGALPQPEADLVASVNDLERTQDPHGVWRRYVNAALAGDYQTLFARCDLQILLAAPDFETVLTWRLEQEHALKRSGALGQGVMDDDAIAVFVSHYERLTRHILVEMPARCDLVIPLDARRRQR